MSFLPVGHTHEDIDQLFSRIAALLRRESVYTYEQLVDVIQRAYKATGGGGERTRVVRLDKVGV